MCLEMKGYVIGRASQESLSWEISGQRIAFSIHGDFFSHLGQCSCVLAASVHKFREMEHQG